MKIDEPKGKGKRKETGKKKRQRVDDSDSDSVLGTSSEGEGPDSSEEESNHQEDTAALEGSQFELRPRSQTMHAHPAPLISIQTLHDLLIAEREERQ